MQAGPVVVMSKAFPKRRNEMYPDTQDTNSERQSGRKAQMSNINAAKAVADVSGKIAYITRLTRNR